MLNHWLRELHRHMTLASRRARRWPSRRFRPTLRRLEDRLAPAVLTVQEGANGYAGTHDTEIRAAAANTSFGIATPVNVDLDDQGGQSFVLLRFANLFGTAANQIPTGSTINSATLTINSTDGSDATAVISFHRMLVTWDQATATWNTFGGNGVQHDGTEAVATPDGTIPAPQADDAGVKMIDVAASLRAWAGGAGNFGWYIITTSGDGFRFDASEATTTANRPSLTVDYTPPGAAAAPRVASTQINGGAAQRSTVTTLAVTFNTVVTFASNAGAAFTLTRVGGGAVNFTATAATVGTGTVVTLTGFTGAETTSGSLNDGRYTLTALANQITAGGQQLDGNGDGTAGDNFTLAPSALHRLYGDSNGDARVDNVDFFQFRSTFGLSTGNPAFLALFDYDGNGLVDNVDFFQFRPRFGTSI